MANTKKLIQAASGAAGAAGLNVEEVFSTYLYDGTGATQSITNDIDLSGEGGMTWLKIRSLNGSDHSVYDTERGATKRIVPNSTGEEFTRSGGLTSFNSDGFTLGNAGDENQSGANIVSWTFRKAPKFFDVVTYTGDGTAGRTISHNLGSVPGMIIVKSTSNTYDWVVYHRGMDATAPEDYFLRLNTTAARSDTVTRWNDTAPTSTEFTVGDSLQVNGGSGQTYVAYLFAHNDGDGDFGPDGDADIIKCGSYTGNGSTNGPEIDLGFEPQWVLVKQSSTSGQWWQLIDVMRGFDVATGAQTLGANASDAEYTNAGFGSSTPILSPTATGFQVRSNQPATNSSGATYIYIAIRRGPMAVPESATDVFNISYGTATAPWFDAGFPVDLGMHTNKTGYSTNARVVPRLTSPNYLYTSSTSAEISADTTNKFDYMEGYNSGAFASTDFIAWMWRRAPNYFDVVAYTGNNSSNNHHTINHNLGVAPEMIWFKRRDSTGGWGVLVTALGTVDSGGVQVGQGAYLNETSAFAASGWWGSPYVAPTDTTFTVRGSTPNASGGDYIAYLFASLDGVSKVGSYTGTGATLNIDCGFSSGARFILIKRTDSSPYDWFVWDSERGIVAGNDPRLNLNTTNAEVTTQDDIDPYSSGFTISSTSPGINTSGGSYIFYAIA